MSTHAKRPTNNNKSAHRKGAKPKQKRNPNITKHKRDKQRFTTPLHKVITTTPPKRVSTALRRGVRPNPLFPDAGIDAAYAGNPMNLRSMQLHGDMYKGITMKVCVPFADVNDAATPTASITCGGLGVSGYSVAGGAFGQFTNVSTICLSPFYSYAVANSTTVTNNKLQIMSLFDGLSATDIAAAFSSYRPKTMTFHYEGAGLTSQQRNFIFCYSTDPLSPLVGLRSAFSSLDGQAPLITPTALANTNRNVLDQCANSVVFANWQSWSLDVPVESKWYDMYAPAVYTGVTTYGYYNSAIVRDSCCAAVTCMNLSGNGGGPQGRIWVEMEVDFKDPTPQLGTPLVGVMPPPGSDPRQYRERPTESESKEEKKNPESKEEKKSYFSTTNGTTTTLHVTSDDDEPEVVSPPRYGTPVSIPGSSTYVPSSTPSSQKAASLKGSSYVKTK